MPKNPHSPIVIFLLLVGAIAIGLFSFGLWRVFHHHTEVVAALSYREQMYNREKEIVSAHDGLDMGKFSDEGKRLLVSGVMLHPYRWYSIPENFKGQYFTTDKYGYRTNGRAGQQPGGTRIGFFGGSTGFSVLTDDAHTIPALLEKGLKNQDAFVKNFAIGGYSSTTELITFIEVTRRHPMKIALFYDGVNEISRYAEYLQDGSTAPYYETMGYPYIGSFRDSITNLPGYSPGPSALIVPQRSAALPPLKYVSIDKIITPESVDAYADKIIDLYIDNVHDIAALAKSHGIVPVFFWQPDIYATKKKLTDEEKFILDEHPGYKLLAEAVHRKAMHLGERADMKDIHYYDISSAFDHLGPDAHFYDFCHVDSEANRLAAEAILDRIRSLMKEP